MAVRNQAELFRAAETLQMHGLDFKVFQKAFNSLSPSAQEQLAKLVEWMVEVHSIDRSPFGVSDIASRYEDLDVLCDDLEALMPLWLFPELEGFYRETELLLKTLHSDAIAYAKGDEVAAFLSRVLPEEAAKIDKSQAWFGFDGDNETLRKVKAASLQEREETLLNARDQVFASYGSMKSVFIDIYRFPQKAILSLAVLHYLDEDDASFTPLSFYLLYTDALKYSGWKPESRVFMPTPLPDDVAQTLKVLTRDNVGRRDQDLDELHQVALAL